MSVRVKAGTPEGVHSTIPSTKTKQNVKEFDESEGRSDPEDVTELRGKGWGDVNVQSGTTEIFGKHPTTREPGFARKLAGSEPFVTAMEAALSEETNQGNPFDPPAVGSTKPRTLSEAMTELVLRFKLFVVAVWLPEDYEVVRKQPLVDVKEFIAEARALWDSYEPLLGGRNTTTVLQVEAPPELEEE